MIRRSKKSVWNPELRYCTGTRARILVSEALDQKQRLLLPDDDIAFEPLAMMISLCMNKHDQDDGMPIFRAEVERARDSISQLRSILGELINRVEAEMAAAEVAHATREETDYWWHEAEGCRSFLRRVGPLRDGLEAYSDLFHIDLVKPISWHQYVTDLFKAFTALVPPPSPSKPWGSSPGGPPVRFIQKALEEILTFPKGDGKIGHVKLGERRISDAPAKKRKQQRQGSSSGLRHKSTR